MAAHNELGKEGEEESVRFLMEKGYKIRHRNWRSGKYASDARKIRRILSSTNGYLHKYGIDMNVRFDIITVTGIQKPFHIEHIEDAFYPPIW